MSLQAPGHLSRIAGYSRGVANPVVDVMASHLALAHRPPTECRIPFGKRVVARYFILFPTHSDGAWQRATTQEAWIQEWEH